MAVKGNRYKADLVRATMTPAHAIQQLKHTIKEHEEKQKFTLNMRDREAIRILITEYERTHQL